MKIGLLKPDHFGDLLLSAPAVAALATTGHDLTLLCHPATMALAEHLFPDIPSEPILFPHLDKSRRLAHAERPLDSFKRRFDLLVCLRWDSYFQKHFDDARLVFYSSGLDVLDLHVVVEQYQVVNYLTGPYDPLASFNYPLCPRPTKRPLEISHIGLCIAAGYPFNAWPLNHWGTLACMLAKRGVQTTLLGGPAEKTRLKILARAIEEEWRFCPRIIQGGEDYYGFLQEAADTLDLIVATDSGTAHLLAMARPILSLFGGSPWQRYAPLGAANAVITRSLPCSPCRQFDRLTVNSCHTGECLTCLEPVQVMACLDEYLTGADFHGPRLIKNVHVIQAPWDSQLMIAARSLPPYRAMAPATFS